MYIKCELHTNGFSSVHLPFSCSDKLKRSHVSTTIMSLKQHIDNFYMIKRDFSRDSTNSTLNKTYLNSTKNQKYFSQSLVHKEMKCFRHSSKKPQSIYKGGQKVLGLEFWHSFWWFFLLILTLTSVSVLQH